MTAYTLTTELCDEGLRLDRFLSEELEDHSRSFLQKLIKEGLVTVDGKPVKANYLAVCRSAGVRTGAGTGRGEY